MQEANASGRETGTLEFRAAANSDGDINDNETDETAAAAAKAATTSVSYRRGDLVDSRLNPRVGDAVSFCLVTDLRTGALSATKVGAPSPMTLTVLIVVPVVYLRWRWLL